MYRKKKAKRILLGAGKLATLATLLLSASCVSPPGDVYIPSQIGYIGGDVPVKGLDLDIRPSRQSYKRGDIIEFVAEIENVSQHPIWVPKRFKPVFIWYSPRGERDGFLPPASDPVFFDRDSAIRLEPGEKHSISKSIKTHYFRSEGIVEFRAILDIPENTNPELKPFWHHRIVSNGYGVLVSESPEDIDLYRDSDADINRMTGMTN